jgi:hypothetical protein
MNAEDWRCHCGAGLLSYRTEAETAMEGRTHADKVMAVHGLQPTQTRVLVLGHHIYLRCTNGHETYEYKEHAARE